MSKIEAGCMAITFGMPMDNGLLVEVKHSVFHPNYCHLGPCWEVESIGSPFHLTAVKLSHIAHLPESALRRIDNPGDDEADLLLAPLPASTPVPEKVAA